jgi:hypothetical protein
MSWIVFRPDHGYMQTNDEARRLTWVADPQEATKHESEQAAIENAFNWGYSVGAYPLRIEQIQL